MSPSALTRVVVLLSIGVLLYSYLSPSPNFKKTASNVDGFDLVFDDTAAKAEFGLFETGYAIKANYSYFTYRGKLYRSVGGGSVLIRPITNSPASFVVRETALSTDDRGYVKTSLLQVLSKSNGEELAHRRLVAKAVEDGTGWTGDHAIKFVRQVLVSHQAPGHPWVLSDYESVPAKVELEKPTEASPYAVSRAVRNCPESLRVERRPSGSTVQGQGFEFLPRGPLQFVACDSGHFLVASGIYASDLNLDLFTLDGEQIAQGYVKLPLPLEAQWSGMPNFNLSGDSVRLTLLVNARADLKSHTTPYARVHIDVALKCKKSNCPSVVSR